MIRPGYKHNDRQLRPAMVGVSYPSQEPKPTASEESDEPTQDNAESDEPREGEDD